MALDVVGAGFGRTGTLSMKIALEMLGFNKTYHMANRSCNRLVRPCQNSKLSGITR